MSYVSGSVCKYLFGNEANQIFENLYFSGSEERQGKFVDEALEILMKINMFLLTRNRAFVLIDPMAFNNQCHLYALRVTKIQKKYQGMTEEDKCAMNEENRFLHLSMFLSFSLSDTRNLVTVVKRAMDELSISKMFKKPFKNFLLDQGNCRQKAARIALNQLFEKDLKDSLAAEAMDKLHCELSQLAHEKLVTQSSRGLNGGLLYTFPKLSGVAYFIEQISKNNIPFVVKVKILTEDGAGGVITHSSREIDDDEPVIVLEGFAGTLSLPECRVEAKKCSIFFHRYIDTKMRHSQNEPCFYCKATQIDLSPYRERLVKAMASPEEMFYALGVDFLIKQQPEFQHFFEDKERYPHLCELFSRSKPLVEKLGLDMDKPSAFSVCHAYADVGVHGKSNGFQLDMTQEVFLKSRGIL